METTFSSGSLMNDTVRDLKNKDYQVQIKLLALHPKLSLLGTHARFEDMMHREGSSRLVGKAAHDQRFENIIPTLLAVQLEKNYDRLQIYGREVPDLFLIGTNPADPVKLYKQEIAREWPDNVLQFFEKTETGIAAMKVARNAPEREVIDFLNEMAYSYGLTPSEKLRERPVVQKRQGRRKGPRL